MRGSEQFPRLIDVLNMLEGSGPSEDGSLPQFCSDGGSVCAGVGSAKGQRIQQTLKANRREHGYASLLLQVLPICFKCFAQWVIHELPLCSSALVAALFMFVP